MSKKKQDYIIYPLLVIVIVYPFIGDYFFKKKTRRLAVNNKNIIIGCLFVDKKYRHRNNCDVFYSTLDIRISGFPYYSK